MRINRPGDTPSRPVDPAYFTGTVRMDPLNAAEAPGRAVSILVTFEPGARTNWHTHPAGQTLIVTAGCGRCCTEGGAVQVLRPGDVVWFPAGERHWHGAGPDTAMSHIAIQEAVEGVTADWEEPVSDADYGA